MRVNKQVNRQFGWVIGGLLLAIFVFQLLIDHRLLLYLGITALLFFVLAIFIPGILNPLRIVWDKIGVILGHINTVILLFIVFFILIVPLGWLLKLLKKDLLDLRPAKGSRSYWYPAEPEKIGTFEQQF